MKTIVGLLTALLALAVSAGCVAPEEYQSVDPQESEGGQDAGCQTPFITMQYAAAEGGANPEADGVREAFVNAGYEWEQVRPGVAQADVDGGQTVTVVAFDPGTSGEALIVSVIASDPSVSESQVLLAANAADEVVQQAFPNLTAEERIESVWSAECGTPPDPVEIGRAGGAGGAGDAAQGGPTDGAGGVLGDEAGAPEEGSPTQETDYATDAGEPTSGPTSAAAASGA